MEVEISSDGDDFSIQKNRVFSILDKLGYMREDVIRTSYLELLLENEE